MPNLSCPNATDLIDIRQVASEIRARIQQRFPSAPTASVEPLETEQTRTRTRRLINLPQLADVRSPVADQFLQQSSEDQLLAGKIPPMPPTLRGRIGRLLVAAVDRALFWYTPQIQAHQRALEDVIREQTATLRTLSLRVNALQTAITQIAPALDAASQIPLLERQLAEGLRVARGAQEELRQRVQRISLELTRTSTRLNELNIEELRHQLDNISDSVLFRVDGLSYALNEQARKHAAENEQLHNSLNTLSRLVDSLREDARSAAEAKVQMLVQCRRLDAALKQLRGATAPVSTAADSTAISESVYLHFENAFRGTRQDIKKRITPYVQRLRAVNTGTPHRPVLDLGCGRGEWLEVLVEHGISCTGVDSNAAMIDECKQRGLCAVLGDALEYLSRLPEESLGAVTGFHIAEHLPTERLLALLAEIVRALKPGGIMILETPNTENLIVSSKTFYYDPTHRAPIPAPLLQFLVESSGLCSAETVYLHPYPESYHIRSESEPDIAAFLNHYFYGPQDYAIIAHKS